MRCRALPTREHPLDLSDPLKAREYYIEYIPQLKNIKISETLDSNQEIPASKAGRLPLS